MPVQDLPAGIPPPLVAPHSRSDEPAYGDVPMSLGHARRRRLQIRAPQTATLAWRMTPVQSAAFDDWYWTVLRGGAFEARLLVRPYSGAATQEVIARMIEPPRYSRSSAFVEVSVSVVINPTEMGEFSFRGSRVPELTAPPEAWSWIGPYVNNSQLYASAEDAANGWVSETNAVFVANSDSLGRSVVLVSYVITGSTPSAKSMSITYDLYSNISGPNTYWFTTTWGNFSAVVG